MCDPRPWAHPFAAMVAVVSIANVKLLRREQCIPRVRLHFIADLVQPFLSSRAAAATRLTGGPRQRLDAVLRDADGRKATLHEVAEGDGPPDRFRHWAAFAVGRQSPGDVAAGWAGLRRVIEVAVSHVVRVVGGCPLKGVLVSCHDFSAIEQIGVSSQSSHRSR